MMIFLVLYILARYVNQRLANADAEVIVLPCELRSAKLIAIDPMGRFSFDQLHDLGDCLLATKRDQTVNMFPITVDEVEENILFLGVVSNVLEDSRSDFVSQE